MAMPEEVRAVSDAGRVFRRALDDVLTEACALAASRDRHVFEALDRVESACARLRVLLRTGDASVDAA